MLSVCRLHILNHRKVYAICEVYYLGLGDIQVTNSMENRNSDTCLTQSIMCITSTAEVWDKLTWI